MPSTFFSAIKLTFSKLLDLAFFKFNVCVRNNLFSFTEHGSETLT
jgi:hypothetical protein